MTAMPSALGFRLGKQSSQLQLAYLGCTAKTHALQHSTCNIQTLQQLIECRPQTNNGDANINTADASRPLHPRHRRMLRSA
jgi:hypothetical protein